jgi:hypothetical protein
LENIKIMKKLIAGLSLLLVASAANADFFGGNNGEWKMGPAGPYYDESDWPEWTPMYWMEEMMDMWDDNDNVYSGGMPPMPMAGGYGAPAMPYGGYQMPQQPVGYAYPAPVAPVAPAAPVPQK